MQSVHPQTPLYRNVTSAVQQAAAGDLPRSSVIPLSQARTTGVWLSVIIPLCIGLLGVWAGKDGSWDVLNYHWYNPYAFLSDRLGFDIAVGHHATYYNPLLDIPLYLAGEHLPPVLTGFLLSLTQGLNFPLLFWLAWSVFAQLAPNYRLALCIITAAAGMTGAGAVFEVAGAAHDNITSLGVLAALLCIVSRYQALIGLSSLSAARWAGVAGVFVGITASLKLTTATYAVGLGGALLFFPVPWPRRLTLAVACALGGVAGFILGGGFWMLRLWEFSGSPFFPYFNDLLHSPLLASASYRDTTFIPPDTMTRLLFPFFFTFDSFLVAEWHFRDARILTAFVMLPCCLLWLAAGKFRRRPSLADQDWTAPGVARFLTAAAAISYAAWLGMFCIYRYLLPLEMLCPLLIAVALGWIPLRNQARAALLVGLLTFCQAMVDVNYDGRKPWGDRYVEVTAPDIAPDEQAMVLMTGFAPMAFVIPYFPPSIPFLRIDGYLAAAHETTGLTERLHRRVRDHHGRRYVLFAPNEKDTVPSALAAYGLALDDSPCRPVPSNLTEPLRLCLVNGN